MNRAEFLSAGALALIAARPHGHSLTAHVRAIARDMPGVLGVYARTLDAGPPLVAYAAQESFPTASTIKLVIAAAAYAAEEESPGSLERRIVFDRSKLIGGSDFLTDASDGQRFTVHELLVPMIVVSDNTAANLLIEHFGFEAINAVAQRAGMRHTHLRRRFLDSSAVVYHSQNVSTPADIGRLLYLIEHGAREGIPTLLSPEHCVAMLKIMLRQTDRDAIPAALPRGMPVANKTGEIEGTRDDAAVVDPFGDAPFILAIMTKNAYDYDAAYAAIHAATRAVYRSAR